jgi:hypothetical protein
MLTQGTGPWPIPEAIEFAYATRSIALSRTMTLLKAYEHLLIPILEHP